jgi:hypothetical protein
MHGAIILSSPLDDAITLYPSRPIMLMHVMPGLALPPLRAADVDGPPAAIVSLIPLLATSQPACSRAALSCIDIHDPLSWLQDHV